jgi:hypothetical protein
MFRNKSVLSRLFHDDNNVVHQNQAAVLREIQNKHHEVNKADSRSNEPQPKPLDVVVRVPLIGVDGLALYHVVVNSMRVGVMAFVRWIGKLDRAS